MGVAGGRAAWLVTSLGSLICLLESTKLSSQVITGQNFYKFDALYQPWILVR